MGRLVVGGKVLEGGASANTKPAARVSRASDAGSFSECQELCLTPILT